MIKHDVCYVNALEFAVANLKRIFALVLVISGPAIIGRPLLLIYMRLSMLL